MSKTGTIASIVAAGVVIVLAAAPTIHNRLETWLDRSYKKGMDESGTAKAVEHALQRFFAENDHNMPIPLSEIAESGQIPKWLIDEIENEGQFTPFDVSTLNDTVCLRIYGFEYTKGDLTRPHEPPNAKP